MTQAAQLAQYGANNVGLSFKNRIINGDMGISQRNGTSSVSITGGGSVAYTLDRWLAVGLGSGGVFSIQQVAEAPAGFTNSIKATVTTAQASVNASYTLQQPIEGLNISDFGWGTANATAVTLSFWVRSSLTGSFGGSVTNSAFDRTYPFPYTISAANTWEYKTITIPGDTTGTWLTTNGIGLQLNFCLGAESAREATANVWANTIARQPTGSVDLISTLNATWQVTGVQLEKGTVATSFDYLPYTTELQLCQRYYETLPINSAASSVTGTLIYGFVPFAVTKRANPTTTYSGLLTLQGVVSGLTGITVWDDNTRGNGWGITRSGTVGTSYLASNAVVNSSAEL